MPKRSLTLFALMSPARLRLRAFGHAESGATLVEFAILAIPFFSLIFAILETAIVFLAGQFLESAVQDTSRLILTGQAQNGAAPTAAEFRSKICDRLYDLFNCNDLWVNVDTIDDFAEAMAANTIPIDPTDPDKWTVAPAYNPGSRDQIVMVRAYYKWPILINFFGFSLANEPNSTRLLTAVRVFRNEPF